MVGCHQGKYSRLQGEIKQRKDKIMKTNGHIRYARLILARVGGCYGLFGISA